MSSHRSVANQYLAIDFGSSSIKAAVGSVDGSIISTAYEESAKIPQKIGSLAVELDLEETWENIGRMVMTALNRSGVQSTQINGLSITGQRQTAIFLDKHFDVVLASPNNDMRAVFQGAAIDETQSELVYSATRHLPSYLLAWAKLRWLKEEVPQLYERVRFVCTIADWIALRLTGILNIERSFAIESGLVDIVSNNETRDLAQVSGVAETDALPTVDPGSIIGHVSSAASNVVGIPPGTPVIVAGPDTQVALLALGAGEPGHTGVIAGWTGTVQRVTPNLIEFSDSKKCLWFGRHALVGRKVIEANTGIMGGVFDWLASILFSYLPKKSRPAALMEAIESSKPSGERITAHLGPTVLDMRNLKIFLGGFAFPVPLALEVPSAADLGRATLQNFAFAINDALNTTAKIVGIESNPAVGGGLVRSNTLIKMLAAVTGDRVLTGTGNDSLVGAILSAASTVENIRLSELVQQRRKFLPSVCPNTEDVYMYKELYELWEQRSQIFEQAKL